MKPDLLIKIITECVDRHVELHPGEAFGKQLEPLLRKLSDDSMKEGYLNGLSHGIGRFENYDFAKAWFCEEPAETINSKAYIAHKGLTE